MFKYLKKFYEYLSGDSPVINDNMEQVKNKKNQMNTSAVINNKEKNMTARVSYQYPQGNFRFPLVSDDEFKKRPERKQQRRKEEITKKQAPVHTSKKVETIKLKQTFKATEVPSPIYGYNSGYNQRKKEQEIIEFELVSTWPTLPVVETHMDESIFETEKETDNLDFEIQESQIEDVHENEIIEEEIYVNTISTARTESINQSEHRLTTANDSYTEVDQVQGKSESDIEVQNQNQGEKKTQNRRHVPFNVVMLKKDRERLKEKEEVKVENPSNYQFPPLHFLTVPKHDVTTDNKWLADQRELLDVTLKNFNVKASVVNVTQGPSVTRFEVHPEPGVKVNKITNLSDDIKLSLSAKDIRIEAPIPGKNTIGIEVPNKVSKPVLLSEIIKSKAFRENPSPLTVALGLDISGKPIVTDLKKMPHGLIAGATGSGKSVCINSMLISLLYKASPHEVKLLLIDPKMVELAPYNDIPHLVSPVITDVKAATGALKWAVEEMERRYERFAHAGARDISRYNELVREHNEPSGEMPFLVIIIDELADLMMVAPGEVEESICRIAQKARACGIHLILATQRPSVDVITGLIKANVPTRIAFSVSSQIDSRTIIDSSGAEKLLGKGDMLFLENGSSKPVRLQGNFVSDGEIEAAVAYVKEQKKPEYLFEHLELISKSAFVQEEDDLFYEACEYVIDHGGASSSSLQRRFRIGYNRAARLIEMMHDQGIVSEQKGSKPRDVLITEEQLVEIQDTKSTNPF